MATKTRYKSSSPSPIQAAMFPTSPPPPSLRAEPLLQRRSELAILNYHNARPLGESSVIVLPQSDHREAAVPTATKATIKPTAAALLTGEVQQPLDENRYLPFGWKQVAGEGGGSGGGDGGGGAGTRVRSSNIEIEKPRSLSIQSLISSPGAFEGGGERGTKRKGSGDRDDVARSSRGTSVISTNGLSMEDPDVRDAVEALGGLKADFTNSLTAPNSPPTGTKQEPLLNLIQSSASSVHPLLSTALSISSSTYAASKNYIPPFRYVAESAENITAPVVSAVGRRTGLEGYIRRGLAQHRGSSDTTEVNGGEKKRRKAERDTTTSHTSQPPVTAAPQTPGGSVETQTRGGRGWQTRLYYSSTGLATALSDESRRSLKYCLKILFTANANLVTVIETLSRVVDELDQYLKQQAPSPPRLSDAVDRLKDEALKTLKTVVDTISRYAGGALPEQARNIVKRQLLSFPLKWQAAAASSSAAESDSGHTKGKAVRVLFMAREGLDMMRCVAEVVDGTLVSAEVWCDRFGKARDDGELRSVSWDDAPAAEKGEAVVVMVGEDSDGDVTMAKAG